jgi:hypothetical protein
MTSPHNNWIGGLGWALCALATFLSLGSMSLVGWACLVVVGLVPPLVFAALAGGPPITVAEVLYNAEEGR